MLVDLILSASIYLLNIFCPQNNFAQCRKIAVKIEFNNKKASLASLLRPHVSFMFDKRVSGWGQQETLVGSHIAVGWKGGAEECRQDALPTPPHPPGPGNSLCARHPWCSLDRLWASHRWPLFVYAFFFSVTIFIFSQGKALPVVPLRNLCARSSPSRFPRLPQVQGWHWRMWWLSQLAWDGGSICFEYVGFI